MKIAVAALVAALVAPAAWAEEHAHAGHAAAPGATPDAVLKELLDGNARFVAGKEKHPNCGKERRAELASGQKPRAIVVGCADSRVPPELLFDQGLGDLFVVRVAGNVAEPGVVGSAEYAAEHLGSSLLVVLGHEKCGAVAATLGGAPAEGNIGSIVGQIRPTVANVCAPAGPKCDPLHEGVHANANARAQAKAMVERSPVLRHLVESGKLKVAVATYDLATGKVELEK